jgi:hypothetical protein
MFWLNNFHSVGDDLYSLPHKVDSPFSLHGVTMLENYIVSKFAVELQIYPYEPKKEKDS